MPTDKQFKDTWGGQLGMSSAGNIANGFIGGIMGQVFAKKDDKRQISQAQKLQALQIAGNKQMIDYQKMKDLEMWKATSYPGQLEMMEQAGINPALMYGQGGGGGTTVGGSASVSGQGAGSRSDAIQGMGMMMQNQMTQAQIELIKAQTEKTKADTEYTKGPQTGKTNTEIDSLTQGIENQKAQKNLIEVQTILADIQRTHDERTLPDRIDEITNRVKILKNDAHISDATLADKIDIIANEALGVVWRNGLTNAQTNVAHKDVQLKDQQIQESIAKIQQAWVGLDQNDTRLAIDAFKAEMEAQYPGITKALGRVFDDAINSLFKLTKQKRIPHNTIPKK